MWAWTSAFVDQLWIVSKSRSQPMIITDWLEHRNTRNRTSKSKQITKKLQFLLWDHVIKRSSMLQLSQSMETVNTLVKVQLLLPHTAEDFRAHSANLHSSHIQYHHHHLACRPGLIKWKSPINTLRCLTTTTEIHRVSHYDDGDNDNDNNNNNKIIIIQGKRRKDGRLFRPCF
jgi:hypothetical protein